VVPFSASRNLHLQRTDTSALSLYEGFGFKVRREFLVQAGDKKVVMPPSNALPTIAMLLAAFLWSSATPGSKFALTEIAVAEFVFIRLSLAAVALWLIVLATRSSARLRHVGWRPLVMGLLEPGLVVSWSRSASP
jgi:hypothetical protein